MTPSEKLLSQASKLHHLSWQTLIAIPLYPTPTIPYLPSSLLFPWAHGHRRRPAQSPSANAPNGQGRVEALHPIKLAKQLICLFVTRTFLFRTCICISLVAGRRLFRSTRPSAMRAGRYLGRGWLLERGTYNMWWYGTEGMSELLRLHLNCCDRFNHGSQR